MPNQEQFPTETNRISSVPFANTAGDEPIEARRGLLISLLVFALFVLLIGLFLWYKASQLPVTLPAPTTNRPTAEMNNEPESATAEAQTESFGALSTSNEIEAIDADLESTNLDSLESELIQIETELNTSF